MEVGEGRPIQIMANETSLYYGHQLTCLWKGLLQVFVEPVHHSDFRQITSAQKANIGWKSEILVISFNYVKKYTVFKHRYIEFKQQIFRLLARFSLIIKALFGSHII